MTGREPSPAGARAFLERLWNLDNDERPGFLFGYTGPEVVGGEPVPSALFSTEGADTVRERLLDPEKYVAAQLHEIAAQSRLPGDFVPSLCPSLGVVAIPSAFGCEVVWGKNDFPAVKPLIGRNAQKVREIETPGVRDGLLGRILDYTRLFRRARGGRLPIRLTDIQGPLDNAALIWGHTPFMEALVTHPADVHRLLGKITDLTIAFVEAMSAEAGSDFVPSLFQPWMPGGLGLSVSNDECVMISAAMHDTFHLPCLNRLSDAFGGLYIHSCGNWEHQVGSIEKVHNLRGVEFGASETPFESVASRLNGRAVVACRVGLNREFPFTSMADFVRRLMERKNTNRGLFIHVDVTNGITGPGWPPTDLDEIVELVTN